jgi:hypothetical protein
VGIDATGCGIPAGEEDLQKMVQVPLAAFGRGSLRQHGNTRKKQQTRDLRFHLKPETLLSAAGRQQPKI